MTSWLSDSEVKDVTHRRQPAAQARVLQSWGVTFRRRPDGTLLVSREEATSRLAPGSWPDEISRQVIDQPETPEEQQAAFKGWAGPRGIYEPGTK